LDDDIGLIFIFLIGPIFIAGGMLMKNDKIEVLLVYKDGNSDILRTHKFFYDKPSWIITKKEKEKGERLEKSICKC